MGSADILSQADVVLPPFIWFWNYTCILGNWVLLGTSCRALSVQLEEKVGAGPRQLSPDRLLPVLLRSPPLEDSWGHYIPIYKG